MSQEQNKLQREVIQLIVKAISSEIDAASERAGKEIADKFFTHVNSKQELARALGVAFIQGATYVFARIGES